MSLRDKAEAALENPNVLLFLDLLAEAEGATLGYNTQFGGTVIPDLSNHPNKRLEYFNSKSGKRSATTAAGRYQFKQDSWKDQAKRLGLTDFSPRSQDLAAVGLMMYKPKTLDALMKGDFNKALKDYGTYWASLPSSPYDQPNRSNQWVNDKLSELQTANLREKHYQMADQVAAQNGSSAPPYLDKNFKPYQPSNPLTGASSLGEFVDRSIKGTKESMLPQQPATGLGMEAQPVGRSVEFQNSDGYQSVTPLGRAPAPAGTDWMGGSTLDALSFGTDLLNNLLIGAGIEADANRARNEAVAAFTGSPMQHSIELPDVFDQAISKLLVTL